MRFCGVAAGLPQNTVVNGARCNSAAAFIHPNIDRPNLHVLMQNTVTRLVSTGHSRNAYAFNQVEFAPDAQGKSIAVFRSRNKGAKIRPAKRTVVTAIKEVILSAGAVNSPQILMLSGIGDRGALSKLGITALVDAPDVGQHLQDHPILPNFWSVFSTGTYDDLMRNASLLGADIAQWQSTHTGRLVDTPVVSLGFSRLSANSTLLREYSDPAAGPESPHYELLFTVCRHYDVVLVSQLMYLGRTAS